THVEAAVVGRAPGIPVAVHLGAVLDDERRAEFPGGVGPRSEVAVELAGDDAIERETRIDHQRLPLAAHHQADEGDGSPLPYPGRGARRKRARLEPVVREI